MLLGGSPQSIPWQPASLLSLLSVLWPPSPFFPHYVTPTTTATQICVEAGGERRFNPDSKKSVFFQHFQARSQKIVSQDKFRRSRKKSRVPSISRRSKKKKGFRLTKRKEKKTSVAHRPERSDRTTPDGCISFLPSAPLFFLFSRKTSFSSLIDFSPFLPYF